MFDFFRKPAAKSPSAALLRSLERDGLVAARDASNLQVVESAGRYAGRKVTFIRVFDAARTPELGLDIRGYADLDAHPDLVLRAGHVEQDGDITINWRASAAEAGAPARTQGDRSTHADDERFVFTDPSR